MIESVKPHGHTSFIQTACPISKAVVALVLLVAGCSTQPPPAESEQGETELFGEEFIKIETEKVALRSREKAIEEREAELAKEREELQRQEVAITAEAERLESSDIRQVEKRLQLERSEAVEAIGLQLKASEQKLAGGALELKTRSQELTVAREEIQRLRERLKEREAEPKAGKQQQVQEVAQGVHAALNAEPSAGEYIHSKVKFGPNEQGMFNGNIEILRFYTNPAGNVLAHARVWHFWTERQHGRIVARATYSKEVHLKGWDLADIGNGDRFTYRGVVKFGQIETHHRNRLVVMEPGSIFRVQPAANPSRR